MPFAEREFIKKNTYIMTKEMLGYESPSTKVLELHVRRIICQSKLGAPGAAGLGFTDGDNIYDYNEDF